eukprot:gene2408-1758_t
MNVHDLLRLTVVVIAATNVSAGPALAAGATGYCNAAFAAYMTALTAVCCGTGTATGGLSAYPCMTQGTAAGWAWYSNCQTAATLSLIMPTP